MTLFKPKPNSLQAAQDLALEINQNASVYWSKYAELLGTLQATGLDTVPEHLPDLYRIYAECLALHYFFFNMGLLASNGARARHALYPVIYHHVQSIPASRAKNKMLWVPAAAQVLMRYSQFTAMVIQFGGVNSRFIQQLANAHLSPIYNGLQPNTIQKISKAVSVAYSRQLQSHLDGQQYRNKINQYSWKGADALLGEAYCKIQAEVQERELKAKKIVPQVAPPQAVHSTPAATRQSPEPLSPVVPSPSVNSEEPNEWEDPSITTLAQKVKSLIETNLEMLEQFLLDTEKAGAIRQSFVKHQIFSYLLIISMEFQKRHPALLIGYQNHLIRKIKPSLTLLSFSSTELIQGFQAFEASLSELSQQKEMKFFFDSACEDRNSAPSIPGYLSYLVCEEAQINEDPKCSSILFGLFNMLIESAEKEHLFDALVDEWTTRIRRMN